MKLQLLLKEFYMKDPELLPVFVMRKVHDTEDLMSVHQHEFYELVYVIYGRAQHFFEGDYFDIYAGDILLIKPGENHTYLLKPGTSFEIINCLFLPSLFEEEWLLLADKNRNIQTFLDQPFFNKVEGFHHRMSLGREDAIRVLQLLETMLAEQQESRNRYTMIIRLQLLELLFNLIRCYEEWLFKDKKLLAQHNEQSVIVKRVQQYLEENIEQKPDIAKLSKSCNMSSRHLNRLFKLDTGMTIMEMTHHIRIEKAKQLLANTNDRIVDISGKIGYEDTSFFMKLFTRNTGCSPAKYRKQFR